MAGMAQRLRQKGATKLVDAAQQWYFQTWIAWISWVERGHLPKKGSDFSWQLQSRYTTAVDRMLRDPKGGDPEGL